MPTQRKLKTLPTRRKKAAEIVSVLRAEFPRSRCSLDHPRGEKGAWRLLVAVILSAQCTDERVNKVTPGLYEQFPTIEDFAEAPPPEIEQAIRSTGFFRNKAKSLQGAARGILTEHGGKLPRTMAELIKLPGIGRKTANVVLGEIWNEPDGVVVDTHVGRISRKLGLTDQADPVKIERQLNECVARDNWRDFAHLIIDHGRKTCKARSPRCDECPLYRLCEVRA